MKRVKPMLLITVFLTTMLFVPSVFVFSGSNALVNIDATPESLAITSQVPRDARVAIYDEDNLTIPVISHILNPTNNLAEVTNLLEAAGHSVDLLTEEDILDHKLLTADYDVFIMVNNVPRPTINDLVKEFWLGGGSLLTFNGAVSFLWYEGIIISDMDYDNGYGMWWGYFPSDSQTVVSRHPTMTDYHVDDIIYERAEDWATSWEPKLIEGRGSEMTFLTYNATQTDFITAFAIDNKKDGGRVVQLPGDGSSIATDFESIILDSVNWLIPTPKGRIVFDLSHMPRLSVDAWDGEFTTLVDPIEKFTQFRTLAVNHTYTFDKLYPSPEGNFTAERLAKYDVLVIIWPDIDFTAAERVAVDAWVQGGGSILVLGDRTGLSGGGPGDTYLNQLLQNFDMSLGTTDVLTYAVMTPDSHLTLEDCSGLYIGYRNYLSVIGDATSVWLDGSDTVVAAQEYGQGRAILSADMNIFADNQLPEENNALYALNALNWLTAVDAKALLLVDYITWGGYGYHTPVALAMNSLGISYQLTTSTDLLSDFMDAASYELIVVNVPSHGLGATDLDVIESYVDDNGSLIICNYDMDAQQTHTLWPKIGVDYVSTISAEINITIWDSTHPIFNLPNDYGETHFYPFLSFGDDGDLMNAIGGATPLAGFTATPEADNALIVLSADQRVLYNGYLFDEMEGDLDDSTYDDRFELWENEIAFMFRPTVDSPSDFNFTAGTTGNEVVWHGDSYSPDHYEILQNGSVVASGDWNGTGIALGLDAVEAGVYEYQINIYDITGNSATDAVIILVLPSGILGIDPMLLLGIGIAAVAIIVILALGLKRRGAGGKPKPKKRKKK